MSLVFKCFPIAFVILFISTLPGCKASSVPETPQPHIDLIGSKATEINSRKFNFQDFTNISFKKIKNYQFTDIKNKRYAIGVSNITPIKNGTVELQFLFVAPQENTTAKKLENRLNHGKEEQNHSNRWVSSAGTWTKTDKALIGKGEKKQYANPGFQNLGLRVAKNPNILLNKALLFKNGLVRTKFIFSNLARKKRKGLNGDGTGVSSYAGICVCANNNGHAIILNDSGYIFLGLLNEGLLSFPQINPDKYIKKIALKPNKMGHELEIDFRGNLISVKIDNSFAASFQNPIKEIDPSLYLGLVSADGSDKYVTFKKPYLETGLNKKTYSNEKEISDDNFAGIGLKMPNNDSYYTALFYESGKLTFGKLGEPPIVARFFQIKNKKDKVHKLKISFLDNYLVT